MVATIEAVETLGAAGGAEAASWLATGACGGAEVDSIVHSQSKC
jgi:hypothetical protein